MSRVPLVGWTIVLSSLAGWTELLLRLVERAVTGDLLFENAQIAWITPASVVALILPGGLAVAAAHRLLRRVVPAIAARALIAFPAVFSVCWMAHPRLHRWAVVALSAGVAIQLAHWLDRTGPRLDRLAWRAAITSLSAILLTAVGVNGWYLLREHRMLAGAELPSGRRPNVLLLVLDTVRARSLSLYGYERPTSPALERLAARGVTFERAYSTAPWTLPSHATLFTGRYPFELSTDWLRALDTRHPTLAEAFLREGYETAGFVANLLYTGRGTGLDRGFAHYTDWPLSAGRILEGSSLGFFLLNNPLVRARLDFHDNYTRKHARDINREFLAWLDGRTTQRPFFAFLNYYDAHEPYLPPAPFDRLLGPLPPPGQRQIVHERRADGKHRGKAVTRPDDVRTELLAYESAIASLDHELGSLFDELDRRGLGGETVVLVTSDHGELHGEHGLFDHGNSLYDEVLHVPLVAVYPPRLPAGVRIPQAVSLRDLAATVSDLAGLGPGSPFPGSSLAGIATGRVATGGAASTVLSEVWPAPNQDASVPVARGYMRSLATSEAQYIRNGDGLEELYALPDTAGVDLSGSPDRRDSLARLRATLDSLPAGRRSRLSTPRAVPHEARH